MPLCEDVLLVESHVYFKPALDIELFDLTLLQHYSSKQC